MSTESPEHVEPDPGFAPQDPTDGRAPFEWQSRWDKAARRWIWAEAVYLGLLFGFVFLFAFWTWSGDIAGYLDLTERDARSFDRYACTFLGGLLGGTLFDLKWLYHTVARGSWHLDRRLWRLMTPWISAGLAFALMLLAVSGLVPLLDDDRLRQPSAAMGVSFLVGYFSDNTVAAMARLSGRLFGDKEKQADASAQEESPALEA